VSEKKKENTERLRAYPTRKELALNENAARQQRKKGERI